MSDYFIGITNAWRLTIIDSQAYTFYGFVVKQYYFVDYSFALQNMQKQ